MPPKFKLQSVLDYHHKRVEIFEVELSHLIETRREALQVLDNLFSNQEELLKELTVLQSGELDMSEINQARFNLRQTERRIERQQKYLQDLEKSIEAKEHELIEARQDEAVMDKLREKEAERYTVKLEEQEKILQDDIYISRAHARMNGESKGFF